MAKSPQTNYFKRASTCEKFEKYLAYTLTGLTIVLTLLKIDYLFLDMLLGLGFVLIVILDRAADESKYTGEKIRRMDFIDHSFATKYIENGSEKYYDNDEIEYGFYKMVVNCFENSLFSSEISKKMYEKKQIKLLFISGALMIFCILGLVNMKSAMAIIQLLLSGYFFLEYRDLKEYKDRTEQIFLDFKKLFDNGLVNKEESIKKNMPEIIRLYTVYETNISDKKLSLDSQIYEQLNDTLTQNWEKIKIKYEIK